MHDSVFFRCEFLLLLLFSVVLPVTIYVLMWRRRAISLRSIALLAVVLVALAAIDFFLLRRLSWLSSETRSTADDWMFRSQISTALYVIPAVFASIGANLLSHALIRHLSAAEREYEREHPEQPPLRPGALPAFRPYGPRHAVHGSDKHLSDTFAAREADNGFVPVHPRRRP